MKNVAFCKHFRSKMKTGKRTNDEGNDDPFRAPEVENLSPSEQRVRYTRKQSVLLPVDSFIYVSIILIFIIVFFIIPDRYI